MDSHKMFQDVVYRTRSQADRDLEIQAKQQFILKSQKEKLWISPRGSYEKDAEWRRGAMAGCGGYADCFIAQDNTSKSTFCIKSIRHQNWACAFQEAHILCHLQHEHIVEFYGVLFTSSQFWILMTFVPGMTLTQWVDQGRKSNLHLCLSILRQLLECLVYLQMQKVTHGDIRLDNIMITCDQSIHLIDFGLSTWQLGNEVESVIFVFVHLLALSVPWQQIYTGTKMLRTLLDTTRLPCVGPPGLPVAVAQVIYSGLGFRGPKLSAENLLNIISIPFIDDAVRRDPVFSEPVDLGFEETDAEVSSAVIPSAVEDLINMEEDLQ